MENLASEHNQLKLMADKINLIKEQIKEKISSLPENSKLTKVGNKGFSINFTDLSSDLNLSPSYYNFKYQYEKINEFIESISPFAIESRLNRAINERSVMVKNCKIRLHPEVIEYVKELLDK